MANVLLVGTATLDIVYRLDHYPQEDDEVRAQGLRVCRGGNAANTAVVLARLGHRCSFAGVLAGAPETAVIEQDFLRHGVDFSPCVRLPGRRPPTSSIYLSGSGRTIVHYRDLPELTADQFASVDVAPYDWIHFEGRNVPELLKMLDRVKKVRPDLPVSLEIEKPREGIEAAMGLPLLLICSQGYARHCGYDRPERFLTWLRQRAPQADLAVAWGRAGAYGLTHEGAKSHSPAFPPSGLVVDTLGAGDTFNAGLIDARLGEKDFQCALETACKLAGAKCAVEGFELDFLPEAKDTPLP